MLRPPFKKDHLLLAAKNLKIYSKVNHAMQTTSTMARASFSPPVGFPNSSFGVNSSNVFKHSAIVDNKITDMLTPATTCKTEQK